MSRFTNSELRTISRLAFYVGFAFALLTLQGCGWFAGPSVDTERKAVVVASAEVRGAALLLESLIDSRSIDARNARLISNALNKANGAIDVAWAALKVSDFTASKASLSNVNAALEVALNILGEYTTEDGRN